MRFTQEFRQTFGNTIGSMFTKYIHTIHPWEFNNHDLYWYAWSEEVGEAMRFLNEQVPKKIVRAGDDFRIDLVSIAGKRDYIPQSAHITLSTSDTYMGWTYPDAKYVDSDIRDPAVRSKLLSWIVKYYRLNHIAQTAERYVDEVLENSETGLNTPGQLYRVWPEIASVMPQRYSRKVMGQKLTSTLPKSWVEHWEEDSTLPAVENFRSRQYFDEINTHFLAMSIMECEEADNYPAIY